MSGEGKKIIMASMAVAISNPPLRSIANIEVFERALAGNDEQSSPVLIRAIKEKPDKFVTAFPYFATHRRLSFETRRITEWAHAGCMEAIIMGGGENKFGVGFFASDYAWNKALYQSPKNITIHLSAIALTLEEFTADNMFGKPLSPDFTGFMPSTQLKGDCYYDFTGLVKEVQMVKIKSDRIGYLMSVQLITPPDSNDQPFITDMFVNQENMRFDTLKTGMQVTGLLWFQGEIAGV